MPPDNLSRLIYCIIYCRVSSAKQMSEGDGLRSQEKCCRDYAQGRGYQVLRVFTDGITGAVDNRRGMNEMLAFLEEQDREIVVLVDDIKRFARDVSSHFDLKAEIYVRGGRLESPLFRFDDTPEGKFVETVHAAQAELERNQNRRQVLNRMRARLEQGYWTFHCCPGYRFVHDPVHKKVLAPDENRAPLVKEALEGYASGRFGSVMDVYRFLREAGFYGSFRSQQPTRHIMMVHRMLRWVLYTGYLEYPAWGITLRKAQHPALISLDTFEKIQERLDGRSKPVVRVDTREEFPLRNFVLCAACGKALTASWSRGKRKRYAYYHCCQRGCSLYGKGIPKDKLEGDFINLLRAQESKDALIELARQMALIAWKRQQEQTEERAVMMKRRMREIEAEMERLSERIAKTESEAVFKVLEGHVERLVRERHILQEKAATPASEPAVAAAADFGTQFEKVRKMLKSPCQTWESGDLRLRRTVMRLVFTGPLPYVRKEGFGTPELSLPYTLLRRLTTSDSTVVDLALQTSNTSGSIATDGLEQSSWEQFIDTIRQWSEALSPVTHATLRAPAATKP